MSDQQPKRAAIYVRVSTLAQEDGASLDTQEQGCRDHCQQNGYLFDQAHLYREIHTGADLWERSELMRLRRAIHQRAIEVIVVYAIDRLSRDPNHLGLLLSEAERVGITWEFVTERLDDTPVGQFVRHALGFVAAIEREKIQERTRRGLKKRAQDGKILAGSRPLYGYRWDVDLLPISL